MRRSSSTNEGTERRKRYTSDERRRDSYVTRYMVGLTLSLSVLLAAVHLPLHPAPGYVQWFVQHVEEQITLEAVEVAEESTPDQPGSDTPATRFERATEVPPDVVEEDIEEVARPAEVPEPKGREDGEEDQPGHMQVATFAEIMPKVSGGMRNYYLHINYPEEARQQGIEGRLVLEFIVETDGSTSDIEVTESLHPLCDSAAVRALRQTHFIPATHNGEPMRVKMLLPVRFRLMHRPVSDIPSSR